MQTLTVTTTNDSYPIYIAASLLNHSALLQRHIHGQQVMIISNETVAPLYIDKILPFLNQNYQCNHLLLPDGEAHKNFYSFSQILDALAMNKHHRDTTLIALGGGVVGDITGFAAACYHRGVHFIQIPTTLLAQVDSSIGGKTAINHSMGKNLIGAFHQPKAVIIDTDTLATLPEREFHAGLAEMVKAALISDKKFFSWLSDNIKSVIAREPKALIYAIEQACLIKCNIVTEDEKEQGVRALLNLGHTFGHAIEQNLGYGKWLHGEAVAVGILMAAHLSNHLGWLSAKELTQIQDIFTQTKLPLKLPSEIKCDKLLAAMEGDKKVLGNQLRLILLKSIGHAVVTDAVSHAMIQRVVKEHG